MGNRCNHPDPVMAIGVQRTRSETEPVPTQDHERSVTKEQYTPTNAKRSFFMSTVLQPWSKGESVYQSSRTQAEFADFRQLISEKDEEIESLRQQLHDKEQLMSEIQETVEALKEKLLQLHYSLKGKFGLNWMEKVQISTESTMCRGSAAAVENVAYFHPGTTDNVVYSYKSFSQEWSELQPHCPHRGFTLVAIDGQLTAVGGSEQKGTPGNALLTFNKGEWTENFPRMTTQRITPAAVCASHSLVVAGGCIHVEDSTALIEIMDTRTLQWHTATHLPTQNKVALNPTSIVACGDSVYVFGEDQTRVLTCSLSELLEPSSQNSAKVTRSPQNDICIWNRVSDLPISQSTVITLCGQLLSVGGRDENGEIDVVYCYDPSTDKWTKVGNLISPKTQPLATTLPGDKLVVVHENYDRTFIGTATLMES